MRATKSFFASFLLLSKNRAGQYVFSQRSTATKPTCPASAKPARIATTASPGPSTPLICCHGGISFSSNFEKPEKCYSKAAHLYGFYKTSVAYFIRLALVRKIPTLTSMRCEAMKTTTRRVSTFNLIWRFQERANQKLPRTRTLTRNGNNFFRDGCHDV